MTVAQAHAPQADNLWRVVAVRVSDPPFPGQEPLGGLTLEDLQEFLSGTGQIERITCSPFPRKGPVLLIDALVQYADPTAAQAAVTTYHGASMMAGNGCTLSVVIFQAEEVYVDPRDPLAWDVTAGPPMQAPQVPPAEHYDPLAGSVPGGAYHGVATSETYSEAGGRRVVLAHITNLARPDLAPLGGLTLDSLHAVFSQCGVVEKIACTATPRSGTPLQYIDAMVQFATAAEASYAVQSFDGTSLSHDGNHHAQMKFSKHPELRTSGNSERTKVFVSGPAAVQPQPAAAGDHTALATPVGMAPAPIGTAPMKRPLADMAGSPLDHAAKRMRGDGGVNAASAVDAQARRVVLAHITELTSPAAAPLGGLSVDDVFTAFAPYGAVEKIVCVCFPKAGPPLDWVDAMVQFRSHGEAAAALLALDGASLRGDGYNRIQCKWSRHLELTKQGESDCHRDYTLGMPGLATAAASPAPAPLLPVGAALATAPAFGAARPRGAGGGETPVLAVFNLPEEMADPDLLFNIFSLYGYVEIVKVVFKRPRDTALVQFSEAGFVDLAVERLQGAMLRGRPMEVRRSKQASIRCTDKDLNSTEKTTRAYTMQEQFWSKKEYQKIWDNVAQPSRTLYVKNIAPQLSEQDLLQLFGQHGPVTDFGFLPCKTTGPARFKTAVVQMAEVADAVAAVILVQRERFPSGEDGREEMRLMACFSKKDEMPKNVIRNAVPQMSSLAAAASPAPLAAVSPLMALPQ